MLQAAALQSAVVETLKARVSADNALALWSAGERLAMPDVSVTNMKDKETMLPIIQEMDKHVSSIMKEPVDSLEGPLDV